MTKKALRGRAAAVELLLTETIPEPRVELDFKSPWQLLVATILAAQSTDKVINTITPALFDRWPTPADLAAAPQEEVEVVVKQSGFFRNKAKAIRRAAQVVAMDFGGEVPKTMKEVLTIPGAARKTANVVLGSAYGIPAGMVVDTHVNRVSNRLALTVETKPQKVEKDLTALYPQSSWIDMSHRFTLHGRYTCKARKPNCPECPLQEICPRIGV